LQSKIAHTADDVWSFNIFKESKDVINYVVCVAEWIAEKLSTAYGLYKDKIVHIWNGVDTGQFDKFIFSEKPVIGYIGRIVGGKNVSNIINALEHLPNDWSVVIKGWGDDLENCKQQAAKFGERVTFLDGSIDDRLDFYNMIGFLCLPSTHEGNSMIIIEALVAGIPIIATSVGAVDELIGYGAYINVIPDPLPVGIANAALQTVNHSKLLLSKAFAVRHLGADSMAEAYYDLITSCFEVPDTIGVYSEGGYGDLIMSMPTLKQIRQLFGNANIRFFSKPDKEGFVDNILSSPFDQTYFDNDAPEALMSSSVDTKIFLAHEHHWRRGGHIIHRRASVAGVVLDDDLIRLEMNFTLSGEQLTKFNSLPDKYICIHRVTPFECKMPSIEWWVNLIAELNLPVVEVGNPVDEFIVDKGYRISGFLESVAALRNASIRILVDSVFVHITAAMGLPSIVIYGGSTEPEWCGYDLHENIVTEHVCPISFDCECARHFEVPCDYKFECIKDTISIPKVLNSRLINPSGKSTEMNFSSAI